MLGIIVSPMVIVKTAEHIRKVLATYGPFDSRVAFVPTMGALHDGHLALVAAAREMAPVVVVSIFVNPTQFNDPADFSNYPRSLEQDIRMLEAAGTRVLLLPEVATMYPEGTQHLPVYPLGRLEQLLEGHYRPGHFQGVCQVVHRLLNIVQPGLLVMGQKDYQQCMVVQQLIEHTGMPVQLHIQPTIREADGLAMSSRNRRLSPQERQQAVGLFNTLEYLVQHARRKPLPALEREAAQQLQEAGFGKVDYATLADARTLEPATHPAPGQPLVALAAAYLGEVRLIDNLPVPAMAAS